VTRKLWYAAAFSCALHQECQEPSSGGRSEISGNFDVTETKDLANVLRAGKLPASADIVQSEVVGPSLGQEAIDNGTTGDCRIVSITLDACLLWKSRMVCKYRFSSKLTFLVWDSSLGAVLTLPGIMVSY
jgi:SecD/SecF fusion protein